MERTGISALIRALEPGETVLIQRPDGWPRGDFGYRISKVLHRVRRMDPSARFTTKAEGPDARRVWRRLVNEPLPAGVTTAEILRGLQRGESVYLGVTARRINAALAQVSRDRPYAAFESRVEGNGRRVWCIADPFAD